MTENNGLTYMEAEMLTDQLIIAVQNFCKDMPLFPFMRSYREVENKRLEVIVALVKHSHVNNHGE